MSLTEQGLYELKWGWIPTLGKMLSKKRIPDRYYGPTSAHDNASEAVQRLMEISILIQDNFDEIRMQMNESIELKKNIYRELHRVAEAFENRSQQFHDQSLRIADVARSLDSERA